MSFCPTHNIRWARLTAGDCFFRAKRRGSEANGTQIVAFNTGTTVELIVRSPKGIIETYSAYQVIGQDTESTDTTTTDTTTAPSNPSISGIPELREKVNTLSELITMPNRGSDALDTGVDGKYLSDFTGVLKGGSGLPPHSIGIDTGPKETMIHINYAENDSGFPELLNTIYVWDGPSRTDGVWKKRVKK